MNFPIAIHQPSPILELMIPTLYPAMELFRLSLSSSPVVENRMVIIKLWKQDGCESILKWMNSVNTSGRPEIGSGRLYFGESIQASYDGLIPRMINKDGDLWSITFISSSAQPSVPKVEKLEEPPVCVPTIIPLYSTKPVVNFTIEENPMAYDMELLKEWDEEFYEAL